MLLGRVLVRDITDPRPEDVDVGFMAYRLTRIRRFSGHWFSLNVAQHQTLCGRLARQLGHKADVVEWAQHHDDHEYATGDIATPLQRAFGMERIRAIQARWDLAIIAALGLRVPTATVIEAVAEVDALALGLEWRWLLKRDVDELGLAESIAALTSAPEMVRLVRADG